MPTLQERMCLYFNSPFTLFSYFFWAHTVAAGNFSNANSAATCVCLRIILIGAEIFFLSLICILRQREKEGHRGEERREEQSSSGPTSSSIVNRQRRHQSALLARSSCRRRRRRLRLLLENCRPLHHGQTSLVACTLLPPSSTRLSLSHRRRCRCCRCSYVRSFVPSFCCCCRHYESQYLMFAIYAPAVPSA